MSKNQKFAFSFSIFVLSGTDCSVGSKKIVPRRTFYVTFWSYLCQLKERPVTKGRSDVKFYILQIIFFSVLRGTSLKNSLPELKFFL